METKQSGVMTRLVTSLILVGVLAFGAVGQAYASSIIYVRAGATGANNGTSWADAYTTLKTALPLAVSGQQIWVAKGGYKPATGACTPTNTNKQRSASFKLKNGVAIYGGFVGTETSLAQRNPTLNLTVLSGNICQKAVSTDNSYHVVKGNGTDSTAVLDGFTIKAGNANSTTPLDNPGVRGGGMYNVNSAPTLRNLVFSGNLADQYGAGMFNSASSPTLVNVTFSTNSARVGGGGMYDVDSSPTLTNVVFTSNHGGTIGGAGMFNDASSPKLTDVTFTSNGDLTSTNGGGIYNNNNSNPILIRVAFSSNSATDGGGIANYSSSPILTNVRFGGNQAGVDGGGAFNNHSSLPTYKNVTFNGNTAANSGGGMFNQDNSNSVLKNVSFSGNTSVLSGGGIANQGSNPTLKNVTFTANSAGGSGDAIFNQSSGPLIYDNILWADGTGADEISNSSSAPVIIDSIVQGGCPSGSVCTHVLNADPKLGVLRANGGFTRTMALGAGSAAIDAGGANSVCVAKDQRGVTRPVGACDMGAYEVKTMSFTSQASYDGQLLESAANPGTGGGGNSSGISINVGDNGTNQQYRGLLSFDTSSLPDTAAVALAKVNVKQQSLSGNPFGALSSLNIDIATPYFGTGLALAKADFQAAGSAAGTVNSTPSGLWYSGKLNAALSSVNLAGTTQLRLGFNSSSNADSSPDFLAFFSGNTLTAADRPVLTVYYNP